MKRDLLRAFRHYGPKLLLMPVVVIGLILFVFFQYVDDYVAHREEATDIGRRIDVMGSIFGFSKEIEARNALLKPEYLELQSRSFRSKNPDESLDAMSSSLNEVLRSLYFENPQVSKLPATQIGGAALLAMDVKFSGVPQQLPRLEAALAANHKAMRISRLKIDVVDDANGGPSHIEIDARFLGLHIAPEAVEAIKPSTPVAVTRPPSN